MPSQSELLAVLGSGRKTTAELLEAFDVPKDKRGQVDQVLANAKKLGTVAKDDDGKWHAVAPKGGAVAEPSNEEQLLEVLPATTDAIAHTLGWTRAKTMGTLMRAKKKGLVDQAGRGEPWTLTKSKPGARRKPKARITPADVHELGRRVTQAARSEFGSPSGVGRDHPVLGPLYEQRDRLDRAIAILEGRE